MVALSSGVCVSLASGHRHQGDCRAASRCSVPLLPIFNSYVKPFVLYCRPRNRHAMRHAIEMRTDVQNGNWQTLYYDAVVELDPVKLLQKIEAAQKAIGDRLREADPIDAPEQQLIEDARHNLYFLKKHPAA
jgi:hypothetical protein